jgi:hypothetical protein
VRAGAAWLCEFAVRYNVDPSNLVRAKKSMEAPDDNEEKQETEIDRRKQMSKEKAMERMKAQASKLP